MPALNITETLSLTHAVIATSPASPSGPKTVSSGPVKINQTGNNVASGIQIVTTTAAVINIGAVTGSTLGRFAIKNLDGTYNLSILPTVTGAAFLTLLPGEMAQGRFDASVTAPAVVASTTVTGGSITAVTVATGGAGYTVAPTVALAGIGSGTGATFTVNLTGGAVSSVTVNNGGSGYPASGVTATFTGGTFTTAGPITAIAVSGGGTGYTVAPTVTLTGAGAGTGATFTVVLTSGAVSSVTVTAGGSGYPASGVTAAFTGGTFTTAATAGAVTVTPANTAATAGAVTVTVPAVTLLMEYIVCAA